MISRLLPFLRRGPRLLIVRHRRHQRKFYDVIVDWVAANLPRLSPLLDVRDLPVRIRDWSPYVLHVPWLQDPVQEWSPETYQIALDLAAECDSRGIPVINRVDRLLNASKSIASQLMREAGINVPRMAPVVDRREFERSLLGLRLPLFIREDWGHSRNIFRVDAPADLAAIPWSTFHRPLAVEVVDVSDPRDGLHRKYRYFAAGELGVSHHVQISQEWITRGENRVITPQTQADELAYIAAPDPRHEMLQRARRALGLDMVAFDYGLNRDGQMFVWEANPFPSFAFAARRLVYRNPAIHRTILAIMRMYLDTAGLPVPPAIDEGLSLDFGEVAERFVAGSRKSFRDRVRAITGRAA